MVARVLLEPQNYEQESPFLLMSGTNAVRGGENGTAPRAGAAEAHAPWTDDIHATRRRGRQHRPSSRHETCRARPAHFRPSIGAEGGDHSLARDPSTLTATPFDTVRPANAASRGSLPSARALSWKTRRGEKTDTHPLPPRGAHPRQPSRAALFPRNLHDETERKKIYLLF